ncbi:Re/Si-specific NAD(P)(+) transhydrogenase subunit alpha [Geitlerinema sp. PCC 9228]|uniref:Re/Si-specific NAD(P)(+) transhydrogenase subunit alpha n=1 Tax=Geitlerinema sp. PCC 9228 TaxID=111611 RepID=UPI0008F9D95A|nr:Re/Si-specific NAD(P)(+) transhydrogenase subunit alpha [Geitlerinema sp. PCC 9228]
MKIAIAKENELGERRVACVPDVIRRLASEQTEIWVASGAGEAAFFSDADYQQAGASIESDPAKLWSQADVVVKVAPPKPEEIEALQPGTLLVGMLNPWQNLELIQQLAQKQVTALAMEAIPRTSKAQSMDALSSQASIAGYKATLLAATALPKYFPMLTTAAGTVRPAKVFVIGAGVAGLQAIATARRLGAIVQAYDIRSEVKEQIESLGATFVEVELEEETSSEGGYAKEVSADTQQRIQEKVADTIADSDVVLTTAQVPGKKAPQLVSDATIARMRPGSVIVDVAAEQGGNCEGTEAGKDVVRHGVTIIGPVNLPSSVPVHASQLYAKNIASLLKYIISDGHLNLNWDDEIISQSCITHQGEIVNPKVRELVEQLAIK